MSALFGPAGNSNSFKEMGYKSYKEVPAYVEKMGLDCFEYQCGRGVRIKEESARELGALAKEKNVQMSLHAPYYISLSSLEEKTRLNSLMYILQSAYAVDFMGGNRIVVHAGSCGKQSREAALSLAKDTLQRAVERLKEEGLGHIHICPEVMGKVNQLGTLEEVLELCTLDDSLIPCVDFGHLNARTFGGLAVYEDFVAVYEKMKDKLGVDRAKRFHCHFSKIAYTPKGGEKVHLTFADNKFGPDDKLFTRLLYEKNLQPIVICESAGTQAEDAKTMKDNYLSYF